MSDEIIKGLTDVYRKIRNTIRFLLGNLDNFDVKEVCSFNELQEIDKYALSRLQQLISSTTLAYENYEFHKASSVINNFCTVFLSGFYLDALKDILYCDKKNSRKRISAQSSMFEICSVLIRLVSPILSFTAEEAWKELRKIDPSLVWSVFLSDFPIMNQKYILQIEIVEKWEKILEVREKVLSVCEKLRQSKVIGSNLEASLDIIYGDKYSEVFEDSELVNLALGSWDIKYNISDKKDELIVKAMKSEYRKCLRCWRHIDGIKDDLCPRCLEVLK
jgi:isoleucyl-tRNA synthetase